MQPSGSVSAEISARRRARSPGNAWQRDALQKRHRSVVAKDGESCPLTLEPVAELRRGNLYLASDDHLYAGSALARYVVHEVKSGRTEPLSPITRQPLTRDVGKLFAEAAPRPETSRQRLRAGRRFVLQVSYASLHELRSLMAGWMVVTLGTRPTSRHGYEGRGVLLASACLAGIALFVAPRAGAEQRTTAARSFYLARDACAMSLGIAALAWSCAYGLGQVAEPPPEQLLVFGAFAGGSFPLAAGARHWLDEALREDEAPTGVDAFAASSRHFCLYDDLFDDPAFPGDFAQLLPPR